MKKNFKIGDIVWATTNMYCITDRHVKCKIVKKSKFVDSIDSKCASSDIIFVIPIEGDYKDNLFIYGVDKKVFELFKVTNWRKRIGGN